MNDTIKIQFVPSVWVERAAWSFARYGERAQLVAHQIELDRRLEERRRFDRGDMDRRQPAALSEFEHLVLGILGDHLSPAMSAKYAGHKPVVLEGSQKSSPILALREAA